MEIDPDNVIAHTRRWIQEIVIGLNLCPFARRVYETNRIRYIVSTATDELALLADLDRELMHLVVEPRDEVETTLLIHPNTLSDFLDYNDFLAVADRQLRQRNLRGVIQIASFHPGYRFARTSPNAVENYTNRSPYPMLHLLREISITEVSGDVESLDRIPGRNIQTMRQLGRARIEAMLQAIATGNSLR